MPFRSRLARRALPWGGGLFVAIVLALAAYDIARGYQRVVEATVSELDSQARMLAEQATRSVQAADLVLRHLAEQFRAGAFASTSEVALHDYLRQQAIGLPQIDGLGIIGRDGGLRAASDVDPGAGRLIDLGSQEFFRVHTADDNVGLYLGPAFRVPMDGRWAFALTRRLEDQDGNFAGVVGARGRVDHFQNFYRDVRPEEGTQIRLLHGGRALLARYPIDDAAQDFSPAPFDRLSGGEPDPSAPARTTTTGEDGRNWFSATYRVPDYSLTTVVAKDARIALAPWREQALGTAARTLALALMAILLLAIAMWQLRRLREARESLEISQERYALAAAGTNDGIWDHDLIARRAFVSARARELSGIPPGPDVVPLDDWLELIAASLHPDDVPKRAAAMQAHLSGQASSYVCEVRHRDASGGFRWVHVQGLCLRDVAGRPYRMAGSVTDIDERKRAEESLRQSEQRFSLAVTGSNDGILDWDIVNDRMYASERASRIAGVGRDFGIGTRGEWRSLLQIHPDDEIRHDADFRRHLEGDTQVREGDYRIRHPDGEYRWVRIRGSCFRDAQGRPIRWAGSVTDIDAQKRTEEALRQSEERYTIAMTGSSEAHWVWNLVSDELYASPMLKKLFGIAADEHLPTHAMFFARMPTYPDDRGRITQAVADHLEGRSPRLDIEYRIIDPDTGGIRWIHSRGQSFRDEQGRATRMAGSTVEITQRKLAEDALRASEEALRRSDERYQLAVDGANQGLWDWDLLQNTLFLSPRSQELMGLVPGEPLRPRREWIDLSEYHEDDLPAVRAAISAHLRGATPHFMLEYRLRHKSDEWHWYRQRGIALRDAAGRPFRMAGSMEDITESKRAEADRARLEHQLLQAKKLEAIGTLAGGIAHDFNNILAAILGNGEMAQSEALQGTALRRHVDAVVSAGLRAKSLVERILAFSRSGIGDRVPVHVQSVVDEALHLVASSLPGHVSMERRLTAGDARVLADPTQIHQVVMNLCTNGVQAMKTRGVLRVALDIVEKGNAQAATSLLEPGRYVRLQVSDSGAGIPQSALERIFDPFFTTKDVGVGT